MLPVSSSQNNDNNPHRSAFDQERHGSAKPGSTAFFLLMNW